MAAWINDLGFNALSAELLPPQTMTTTQTGTGVDIGLAAYPLSVVVALGNVTGTAPTLDVKLQESDAVGGTYTDVPSGAVRQCVAGDANALVFGHVKKSLKRFVRAVATVGGTTPSIPATVLLFAQHRSVGNPNTKGFSLDPAG